MADMCVQDWEASGWETQRPRTRGCSRGGVQLQVRECKQVHKCPHVHETQTRGFTPPTVLHAGLLATRMSPPPPVCSFNLHVYVSVSRPVSLIPTGAIQHEGKANVTPDESRAQILNLCLRQLTTVSKAVNSSVPALYNVLLNISLFYICLGQVGIGAFSISTVAGE